MTKTQANTDKMWTAVPKERSATFRRALDLLPEVETRKMFGCPCAFVNGQMFAVFHPEGLALKLSEANRRALLDQVGAKPFEPMPGRKMREYVVVPPSIESAEADLRSWLEKAHSYAKSLPPKKGQKKVIDISTPNAPQPAGHYAQAIVHDGLVYVSGQLPVDPVSGEKRLGSIEEQAEQALKNVSAILKAAGSDLDHVLKTTVYVSDIGLWGRVNAVYAMFFGDHRPARAVVPTRELHYGFQVEIEAIAAIAD
jgi:2-iminobutanoate/2-iminopropanoate deaminase